MKARFLFAFLIIVPLPASAAVLISGHGTDTCAEFNQSRVISPTVEESYFVWAQGFMSGVNTMYLAGKATTRNLGHLSDDDVKAALRDYCTKNPSDNFESAVVKVLFTMPEVPPGAVAK